MLTCQKLQTKLPGQLADTATLDIFQVHQRVPLLVAQTGLAVQRAFGVRQRDHFAAQVHDFARSVLRHVARTRDRYAFAINALAAALEHFLGEVHATETGGFRANQAAAVAHALAGQHGSELVAQALVLAKQKADFAGADTDITRWHINIRTDMAIQLAHKGLAETHDFSVALALGVEVRATFTAAHRQRGQGVLEGLFKGQEFQNPQVHRRVETQTALVWANGAVHLDPEAAVDPHLAFVIDPRNAEHDRTLRFANALKNA